MKRELQILENRDMIVSLGCAIIEEQSGFDLRLFLDLQDLQGTSQCSIAPRHEQMERQRVYGETLIKAGHLWLTRLELMNEEGRVSPMQCPKSIKVSDASIALWDRGYTNSCGLTGFITTPAVRRTRLSGRPWAAGKNAGEVPHLSWTTRCSLRRTFFLDIPSNRCRSPSSKYPDAQMIAR